jgi:hypothetical protein
VLVAHEELPRQQVMVAIEKLGMQGATGALEVTGSPSGIIYLEGGHIAFAQASGVPGLAVRLRGIRPVPAGLDEVLSARGPEDHAAIATHVVHRGYLTAARLTELIQSIVTDAFLVLTMPLAADGPVSAIRFAAARTSYWPELFPRLGVGPVREEAIRRAERLAKYRLAPTTAVALRSLALPSAVVTREQWVVACHINGPMPAVELAARCGMSLLDTVDCLGGLIWAGLCMPVRVAERRQLPQLPLRVPGAVLAPVPGEPAARDAPPGQPSLGILRQVLHGLRKLS